MPPKPIKKEKPQPTNPPDIKKDKVEKDKKSEKVKKDPKKKTNKN